MFYQAGTRAEKVEAKWTSSDQGLPVTVVLWGSRVCKVHSGRDSFEDIQVSGHIRL